MELSVSGSAAPQRASANIAPKTDRRERTPLAAGETGRIPAQMHRATAWTPEVEDLFRLQAVGWRDEDEYHEVYGSPERWPKTNCPEQFISKLQTKSNGYFTYWRKYRECEESMLRKVKIYAN